MGLVPRKDLDKVFRGVLTDPVRHIHLNAPRPTFTDDGNNYFAAYTDKILASVVDTSDRAIVDAIIREATAQGVNDLFLIDRDFIMSAIKHEMIRRKTEKWEGS